MMIQCQSCCSRSQVSQDSMVVSSFPRFPIALSSFLINLSPFLCHLFYQSIFFSIYFFFIFLWGIEFFFYSSLTIFFSYLFFKIPSYSKILVIEPLQWSLICFLKPTHKCFPQTKQTYIKKKEFLLFKIKWNWSDFTQYRSMALLK